MCFRAVKYLPPRQSYWLYLIHPLSCLPPIYIDYSSMSWLRSKMAAALPQWRCNSLIAIWDFSLCGALGLLCLWQMLSYFHELSYKPMMCFSPSSPLNIVVKELWSQRFYQYSQHIFWQLQAWVFELSDCQFLTERTLFFHFNPLMLRAAKSSL